MDANAKEKRREWGFQPPDIVERSDRFSMDPQRFEEILAEITTGYSNIRSSFENVNIAEILEEMVTEYACARLAAGAGAAPQFAELAVLLQHCAALYGRKVDFLYQHVLDVSEALAAAAPRADPATPLAEAGAGAGARRRRRASSAAAAGGFAHIAVSACAGAARAREPARPPPTLPRMYLELEPRVPAPHDLPLRDAAGEPVGLPADYRVTARLHRGYLVEELESAAGRAGGAGALRPLSLLELQEALAAAAPPDPRRRPRAALPAPEPPAEPTRPARADPPPPAPSPEPCAPAALLARRKRRSSVKLADIVDSPLKAFITEELVAWARCACEFSLPAAWRGAVVSSRARRVLAARRDLPRAHAGEFRGFEDEHPDAGGFPGWSGREAESARLTAEGASLRASDLESDDDGFFEGASFSSIESSRSTPPPAPPPPPADHATHIGSSGGAEAEGAAWSARVAAAAGRARGVDVRALGAAVLRALPPAGALPFPALLRAAAAGPADVSRLLLATLFLANSGNVEIVGAAPLGVGQFSVALVSRDERRLAAAAAAAAAEPALLGPA